MRKFYLIASLLCLFVSTTALAEGDRASLVFGGGPLTFDDSVDSLSPTQIFVRADFKLSENIALGGELGTSLIQDTFEGVDFSVTTVFLFVKGIVPISEAASIYGMFGSTNTTLTGTVDSPYGTISATSDDNDTGYGFGFENRFGRNGFSIDYVKYHSKNSVTVTSINLGYVVHF